MIEGAVLLPLETASAQLTIPNDAPTEGATLLLPGSDSGEGPVLEQRSRDEGDEWIPASFPTLSSAAAGIVIAPGNPLLLERQSNEGDIVITGPRYYYDGDLGGGGGTGGGDTTGSGGGGMSGGAGGGGGSGATAVEPHERDCGTDEGAAVQVSRHVKGSLPAGVSGPENPITTSSGNDWTKVEFGAVIVRTPNGYGALNDMIYSSDLSGFLVYPNIAGQPVQGLWHSHDATGDSDEQLLIDRYPSADDWHYLSVIAAQPGAESNPSLWIMGPDGVTREFKLTEREYFESFAEDHTRMINGEGLDGKERADSCG